MAEDSRAASPFGMLQQLCARHQSGMLFVVTTENRQIRIALDRGTIIHVGFGPRRGKAALEIIAYMRARSAAFSASGAPPIRDEDLPPPDALLKMLSVTLSRGSAEPDTMKGEERGPVTQTTRAFPETDLRPIEPRPRAAGETKISPLVVGRIKEIMIELIGPIAELLVDQEIAAGTDSVEGLVDRLSTEISTPEDVRRFREAVDRALR